VAVAVGAAREEDPQLVIIQKAIPAVCDCLRTIAGVVQTGLENNDSSIQRMEGRMAALEDIVGNFCSGAFNLTFTPSSRRA
jgi:ABC-type enterochelin transport system substrate-binding protein